MGTLLLQGTSSVWWTLPKPAAILNLRISGGNSSALHVMRCGQWSGTWTSLINNLRIGESAFLGWDIVDKTPLPGCCQDVCRLMAEVIEVQVKPTPQKRGSEAVVALGRQDIGAGRVWPISAGMEVVGVTSDHLVLEVGSAAQHQSRQPSHLCSRLRCPAGPVYIALCYKRRISLTLPCKKYYDSIC